MGTRGPVPKRDANRAGHNAKSEKADTVTTLGAIEAPKPDPSWCDEARDWYISLTESGQSFYFEPSDWQAARVCASMLDNLLKASRPSSEMFKAVWSAMESLGTSEGSRRRMRIEVDRTRTEPGNESGAVDEAKGAVAARFAALRAASDV